jgi:hypothetical protein
MIPKTTTEYAAAASMRSRELVTGENIEKSAVCAYVYQTTLSSAEDMIDILSNPKSGYHREAVLFKGRMQQETLDVVFSNKTNINERLINALDNQSDLSFVCPPVRHGRTLSKQLVEICKALIMSLLPLKCS